jgi:hypothetical protein
MIRIKLTHFQLANLKAHRSRDVVFERPKTNFIRDVIRQNW